MKIVILLMSIMLAMGSSLSYAKIESLSQAINESGRLRMLSQRLAKAYFFKALDIQPQKAQSQFNNSQELFEQNLTDLSAFNKSVGNNVAIQVSLSIIQKEWRVYKEVLSQPNNKENASSILTLSDRTLMACEELVTQLEKLTLRESAHWVNLSGRQRMLSQRIAKFYSAISLSGNFEHYHPFLQTAVTEFDEALSALMKSPDNTRFVNHKLKKVLTQWQFSKKGFELLGKGNSTPLVISLTTETILKQMNDITALYEQIDKQKQSA